MLELKKEKTIMKIEQWIALLKRILNGISIGDALG